MRRYRRHRASGREHAVDEHFGTHGLEAEPLSQEPDDDTTVRPFAEEDAYQDELPEVPLTKEGPDPARMLRRARRAARGGRQRDAVQAYRDLLEAAQDNIEGRLEMARLLEADEDTSGAMTHLDRAVELAPDRPDVLTERGALKARLKEYLAAAADLDSALTLDAGYAPAHFHQGMVFLRKSRNGDAAISFRSALSHQADYPQARYYLGEALNLMGEFDSAIATLEQAIESDPTDPRVYRLLGRVLDRCSRPEEAILLYQKAREVAGR